MLYLIIYSKYELILVLTLPSARWLSFTYILLLQFLFDPGITTVGKSHTDH